MSEFASSRGQSDADLAIGGGVTTAESCTGAAGEPDCAIVAALDKVPGAAGLACSSLNWRQG